MPKQTGIKKIANGRYQARYFAGFDSKGKRRYPSRTFDLQSDAVKWRVTEVGAKSSGRHFEIHNLTVAQLLDKWLVVKAQKLRENSLNMYRQSLDAYVKPELGHIKLARLRSVHIEEMLAQLLTRVSGSTAASARGLLHGALKYAVHHDLIPNNPVEKTEAPKRNDSVQYPLTVEEGLCFIEACAGSWFGLYFLLALSTGLRPEEGLALQWPDLELGERGVVHVKRVIHTLKGGGWRWHHPKSKNGVRSIVFPGELATRLTEHRKRQLEQKLKMGQYWQNNDLVFCTAKGTPLRQCVLGSKFKATLEVAKLPASVRLYDLRHAFVTFSLVAGVDAKTVSHEAGHASVGFTLDHYGHVLKEMHEGASDKREQLLNSRAAK
jgi:integrase